jgi:hypothetical protein
MVSLPSRSKGGVNESLGLMLFQHNEDKPNDESESMSEYWILGALIFLLSDPKRCSRIANQIG